MVKRGGVRCVALDGRRNGLVLQRHRFATGAVDCGHVHAHSWLVRRVWQAQKLAVSMVDMSGDGEVARLVAQLGAVAETNTTENEKR